MTSNTETNTDELKSITDQLILLTEALQEQNNILKSCILPYTDKAGSVLVEIRRPIDIYKY